MKTRISLLTILSLMLICLCACENKKELKDFSKKELSLKEPTLKKEPAVKNLPAKILTKAASATVD